MDNKRKHETSHPWITFKADLRLAPIGLWMNLGEAKSKCEHLAAEPLKPQISQMLHSVYLAKGVLATTAIEGNTLTEDEVRKHLEGKLSLPPSKEYLKQEIDNIVTACNQIAKDLLDGKTGAMSIQKLKDFNSTVLQKLSLPPETIPGQFRSYSVGVGPYRGAPAEDCEYLMWKLTEWLEGDDFKGKELGAIPNAALKAILGHLYLAWIHPFGDGNGRTARLMEFAILLSAGVPFPAAHLLSNHYNQTRQEYYRQLDLASKSGGNVIPFICYAMQGFVDGLREQLDLIKVQQWDIVWENYIHELFCDHKTISAIRQRTLALDLGKEMKTVPMLKISEMTTRLAKLYADKTIRTVQRDVKHLEKIGVAERKEDGVRAKRELVFGFLPPRISPPEPNPQIQLSLQPS